MDNKSLSAKANQKTSPPDSSPAEPTTVNVSMGKRSLATTILAILAVIFALRFAQAILVPIFIGIIVSYILSPLVTWMNRLKIPRAVGSALLLAAIIVGAGLLSYSLSGEAVGALEKLPKSLEKFSHGLENLGKNLSIQKTMKAASEIGKMATGSTSIPPLKLQKQQQVPQPNVEGLWPIFRQYM